MRGVRWKQPARGFSATCGRVDACWVVALDLRGFGTGAVDLRWKQIGLSELLPACFSLSLS